MATGARRPRRLPATSVAPARRCAFAVIRRVFEQGAYADRALHAEAASLDERDRALATALSYGTVQRRATLDHVIGRLSSRPVATLEPGVLAALRLGLFQLLLLGGVADHAAVNDSVELAKHASHGGTGFVNAILRRAAREDRTLLAELSDEDPAGAAVLHSVPEWLARRWWDELGAVDARALLERVNVPAEAALRVNTLVASVAEVRSELAVAAVQAPLIPEGLVLRAPFDAHGSELFARGAIMPQSRGSMLVSRVLAPQPGDRVLDLCAAPGGKTTHLAALMNGVGESVAVERNPSRAQALRRTCERMRAVSVHVEVGDASAFTAAAPFDRVLVDPPCSGLGTLQSRPDLRWRVTPESVADLAALQRRILAAGAAATRPGGELVYSVCTISRAEGEDVLAAFLRGAPDFETIDLKEEYPEWAARRGSGGPAAAADALQLLPHTDGTDGFYIARLRRR